MRLIDADKLELKETVRIQLYGLKEYSALYSFTKEQIEEAPTVKAIPVEWILNKYREKWGKAEMGRRDFQFIEVIDELLADWEKENAE